MSYYLEHEGSEHLQVLRSTLLTWAREDQDVYLVSKVRIKKLSKTIQLLTISRRGTECTPVNAFWHFFLHLLQLFASQLQHLPPQVSANYKSFLNWQTRKNT